MSGGPRAATRLALAAAALGLVARVAAAQAAERATVPVARADAIIGAHETAMQAGAGIDIPFGWYVRLDVVGAGGWTAGRSGGASGASGRADVVARFLLDPFRQFRWGPYAGGGASLRWEPGARRPHPFLVVMLGVEAPSRHGVAPALEVGLGGGYRVGLALRRARREVR